jgi:hypothetical protein
LNHSSAAKLNEALTNGDLGAMRPKADALCSLWVLLIANSCFDGFSVRLKELLGISMLRAQNRTDIRAV